MHYFFIILFSLFSLAAGAQSPQSVLSVSTEGTVELPADIIQFNINLNAEESSPDKAFQLHKKRENALVQLLDEYNIDEKDIDFEPISISRMRRHMRPDEEKITYRTSQMVSLTMRNFDNYEKIQLGLIDHGFDNFSGTFTSSEVDAGREEALKKAIDNAREKARSIAQQTGVELAGISKINYNDQQHRPLRIQGYATMRESADQLMDYNQTIPVTASIQIEFKIMEAGR